MTNLNTLVGFGAGGGGGGTMDAWEMPSKLTVKPIDYGGYAYNPETNASYSQLSLRYPGTRGSAWTSTATDRPYKANPYIVHYAMETGNGRMRGYCYCADINMTTGVITMKADGSGSGEAWSNTSGSAVSTTLGHGAHGSGTYWAGGNNAWPGQSSHYFGHWYAECDQSGYQSGSASATNQDHGTGGFFMMQPCLNDEWHSMHPHYQQSNNYQYHKKIRSYRGQISTDNWNGGSNHWNHVTPPYRAADTPYLTNNNNRAITCSLGYRNSSYYYYQRVYDRSGNASSDHFYSNQPQHNSHHVYWHNAWIHSNGDFHLYNSYMGDPIFVANEDDLRYNGPAGGPRSGQGWPNGATQNSSNNNQMIHPQVIMNSAGTSQYALWGPISMENDLYMCRLNSWGSKYYGEQSNIVIVKYVHDTVNSYKTDGYFKIVKSWDKPGEWDDEPMSYRNRSDAEQHVPIWENQSDTWPKFMVSIAETSGNYILMSHKIPPYAEWTDRDIDLK